MRSFSWGLKYRIAEGKVIFSELVEMEQSEVYLLPGWPGDEILPPVA